jgi:hypothetical protein
LANITERTPSKLKEILNRCGAVSYCVDQLLHRYQFALRTLQNVGLVHPQLTESLFEKVIAPVWKLFDAIGISSPRVAIP